MGIIPNDWEVKRLGECISYVKGYAFKNNQYKTEGVRLIRISDTNYSGIKECEKIFIAIDDAQSFSNYKLFEKDILVQTVGSRPPLYDSMVGKAIRVDKANSNTLLNQNLVKIIPTNINENLLYINLKTKRYLEYIETIVRGNANQVSITLDDLFDYNFLLPPLPQQQKIAEILGTWDEAIEKQSKLIDKLTDRKRGLMQQLLTGKKRLAGFSEEWKEVRLGEICDKISNGITYNTDLAEGYPVTRIETISKGVIDYAKIGFAQEVNNMESYKLQKGDILFSHINSLAHIGKVAIYKGENPLYHGMNLLLLRTSIKANDYYLFYFLCSSAARNKIQSLAKQAVNQASVNIEELKKWFILLPSLPEQTAIANILTAADKEIEFAKSKLELLRSQKSGVMQELLTGKTRVKIY